jgi:hypothetical protein
VIAFSNWNPSSGIVPDEIPDGQKLLESQRVPGQVTRALADGEFPEPIRAAPGFTPSPMTTALAPVQYRDRPTPLAPLPRTLNPPLPTAGQITTAPALPSLPTDRPNVSIEPLPGVPTQTTAFPVMPGGGGFPVAPVVRPQPPSSLVPSAGGDKTCWWCWILIGAGVVGAGTTAILVSRHYDKKRKGRRR